MSAPLPLREDRQVLLLVDDDAKIRSALARILSREPYVVVVLASGREALEFIRAGHRVDLLLTDVRMPEMDGVELGQEVAMLRPDLARIYMSGDLGCLSLEPGAVYLVKPFTPTQLLRLLHARLGSEVLQPQG